MKSTQTSRFTFVRHWKEQNSANDELAQAFWKSEGALANDAQIKERLSQIVLHAKDADGRLAAVCTAVPVQHPRLEQPVYYYRCFVGKDWRKTRLLLFITAQATSVLEEYAIAHGYPCVGVLVELENTRFTKKWRMPVWPYVPFVFIGKSQRNAELRIYYFAGARLKD
ncbi:MAG: hypothetical protein JSS28_00520 [Proteobacteria bacterium]|nr:hypothetical protein [Pseudomonadota bacterium]